jgi:alpha-amylase/alpha-mannosidase (GH57 family)
MRAHREQIINRFEPYRELVALAQRLLESGQLAYSSPQFVTDLAVWYHLAWCGETVRRGDPRVQELMSKARAFEAADCRVMLECVADVLSGLVPRYRRLAGSGQVKLSVSPWGHPILPLMLDFAAARESEPSLEMPAAPGYPGGEDRARWHIARALQVFSRAFGVRPRGCWPSEGAVSEKSLELLESFGFDWVASGEHVLRNSLVASADPAARAAEAVHGPYQMPGRRLACFFRDDELSDRIGFTYNRWHGDDASGDFVHRLTQLADAYAGQPGRAVAIILDGENAWEYYPFNAFYFLRSLYERLAANPKIRLTTFSRCVADGLDVRPLPRLVAGSWIHGSLATWIGNPTRNRAWDMLCDAKQMFDQVVVEGGIDDAAQLAAERQLGVCEGSDWFWWFADYNPADAVDSFDELYRRHLLNLYRLLGEQAPDYLGRPFAHGGGAPELGGAMLRAEGVAQGAG